MVGTVGGPLSSESVRLVESTVKCSVMDSGPLRHYIRVMAFVRKRETKTGAISTALVEAYRDEGGRPRQRVLANLRGAETALEALAQLAAQRHELKKEKKRLQPDLKVAEQIHSGWMTAMASGQRFSAQERKDIDRLLRARKKLLKRSEKVDALLNQIERDGAIIKKHCDASPDEIQAAIKTFQKRLRDVRALIVFAEMMLYKAKEDLQRLSPTEEPTASEELRRLAKLLPTGLPI